MKKVGLIVLIFSLLVPMIPAVLAEDICTQAKNATCDNVATINGDQVKKNCDESIFQKYSQTLIDCKNQAEQEEEKLNSQIKDIEQKERSAEWYLSKLNLDVRYLNYEIANLNLSISQLESEIKKREEAITELDQALEHQKSILSEALRQVYEYDLTSYVEVLIGYGSLSDFGSKLMEMDKIQIELRAAMSEIQEAKDKMEKERMAMEKDMEQKVDYKKTQEYSIYSLAVRKDQQEYLLRQLAAAKTPLEREMARIEAELIELRSAMSRIQTYLSMWLIDGKPTWSQIFSAVERASSATGVRSALLLGVLQIESRFGTGLGTAGNYKKYCSCDNVSCWGSKTHIEILLEICQKYGYDPNEVPMSKKCALGPAQFIPITWYGYMGLANPWNLNDAVMGMAKYLARNGAASGNERGALHVYNHSWSYVDSVLESADAWQEVINICGGLDLDCPRMRERLEQKFGSKGIPIE